MIKLFMFIIFYNSRLLIGYNNFIPNNLEWNDITATNDLAELICVDDKLEADNMMQVLSRYEHIKISKYSNNNQYCFDFIYIQGPNNDAGDEMFNNPNLQVGNSFNEHFEEHNSNNNALKLDFLRQYINKLNENGITLNDSLFDFSQHGNRYYFSFRQQNNPIGANAVTHASLHSIDFNINSNNFLPHNNAMNELP